MSKAIVLSLVLFLAGSAPAGSANLTATAAWDIELRDAGGGTIPAGSIDVFSEGGSVYILNWRATATDASWQETAHELSLHHADGSFVRTLAADSTTGYKSFVRRQADTVYYGLGNDIYSVGLTAPAAPVLAATLGNNWDLQFAPDGTAYAVANPTWSQNNIYRVDLSGADNHVKVVRDAGVYSSELALDGEGNLYYGTFGSAANELVRFSKAQLEAVAGAPLEMPDAMKLTDLPYGAGGIEVDAAGNVLFTMNDSAYKALCVISGRKDYSAYGAFRYDHLSGMRSWTVSVDALGDVLADGTAFVSDNWVATAVPEPAAMLLLAVGVLAAPRRPRPRRRATARLRQRSTPQGRRMPR